MNLTSQYFNVLRDSRVQCYSVMITMKVNEYIELINQVYAHKGGILGQRDALKTSSAVRIRDRMIKDLEQGAVLPPVVLGLTVPEEELNHLDEYTLERFRTLLSESSPETIAIIDGMQRTTAIISAREHIRDKDLRVEFWVASKTNSLIYRMLVLNTGQVPWNLRRQLEVVYSGLLRELRAGVPDLNLIEVDDGSRRRSAGTFQADQIIELYLAFGARKEKIDTKERLAEEFTRLDFIEVTATDSFSDLFYDVIRCMVLFDHAVERFTQDILEEGRFAEGKDLFSSQPVRVGFITAIATEILGRPGSKKTSLEEQDSRWSRMKESFESMIDRINRYEEEELNSFLDYTTLNECISRKTGKTGDFEREFFLKAFKALIEDDFMVDSMTSCWRAY